MKYLKKYILLSMGILLIAPSIYAREETEQKASLKMSQAELDSLNLSETDAQALQELTQLLNTMSPEEQELFNQDLERIDRQMKDKGLDPSNPDDIFKFMEQQGPGEQPKPASPKPELEKPAVQIPALVPIANPADARATINSIIHHIGSLQQKAAEDPVAYHKVERLNQELTELVYYLSLLTNESLLCYVVSKDFSHVYKNLEQLKAVLVTHEPQLVTSEITFTANQGNPYDMLQISPRATTDEIELAYEALRETNDPAVLAKKLKKSSLPQKEQSKKLKEAQLSFKFIHNAYTILKDPKQRALLDRTLREQYEHEKIQEQATSQTLTLLLEALSTTLYRQNLLQEIKQLLEKHKPKELEIAKEQKALDDKAAERLKKPIKIETRFQTKPTTDPYAAFYDQVRQEAARSAQQQATFAARKQETRPDKALDKKETTPDKPTGPDTKPEQKGKQPEKPKDDKAKAAADKKEQQKAPAQPTGAPRVSPDKAPDQKKQELSEKDQGTVEALINKIAKESEQVRDSFDSDQDGITRSPDKAKPQTLAQITQELDQYLTQPITRSNQKEVLAAKMLASFINQRDFKDLQQDMRDLLGKVQNKQLPEALKKLWKEKVFDTQGARILSWHKAVYPVLSGMTRGAERKAPINAEKQKLYGLNKLEPDVTKLVKKQEQPKDDKPKQPAPTPAPDTGKIALDAVRDGLSELSYLFKQLSSTFGTPGEPKAPPAKKQ